MTESIANKEDFLALARLALSDRPQDVHLFLGRTARRYRKKFPELADELASLLKNAPNRSSSLRRDNAIPLPVDNDTRLHLIRLEQPQSELERPIFTGSVSKKIDSLIRERLARNELHKAGLEPARSALFVGPPGVGKTLTAKWIAGQLKLPMLVLDLSAVMSSFLGRTGNNVRAVLDYAKRQDCVLLLDELDAIAKRRDDATEIGELKRLVTVLLQEIDEWPSGGLLLAATNHQELLDLAVWRRFDTVIEFPRPSHEEVLFSLNNLLRDEDEIDDSWISILSGVLSTENYSEIEKSVNAIRRASIVENRSITEVITDYIKSNIKEKDHQSRIAIAQEISTLPGISMRKTSEITGVSRDTLRQRKSGNARRDKKVSKNARTA